MTEGNRFDGWMEVACAVVLSASALMTSWASYQASLWDGEQAALYSRANAFRIQASQAALEGDAREAIEVNLFTSWLTAPAPSLIFVALRPAHYIRSGPAAGWGSAVE